MPVLKTKLGGVISRMASDDGAVGPQGTTYRSGSGVPAGALGNDGDYYLDTDTGDVYLKASGAWSQEFDLQTVLSGTYLAKDDVTGATVAAYESTPSLSFTDLATLGPAVTVDTGTRALVFLTGFLANNTAGFVAEMGFAVSGASSRPAGTNQEALYQRSPTGGHGKRDSILYLVTGLTAGSNTFTAKYRAGLSGTADFESRGLTVIPL